MKAKIEYSDDDVKAMVLEHAKKLTPAGLPHAEAEERYGHYVVTAYDDAEWAAKLAADREYAAKHAPKEAAA